jgi:large subunit ribosomal protein L1|tara:strand:- start:1853 stop:2605 length:753 start_codon:yes stop_codon:yes gene_type:complete
MNQKDILNAVKQARSASKERKFKQTFDIVVNFRDLDMKNPAHKFKESIILPHGRGKPVTVAAFADGIVAEAAKTAGIEKVIDKAALKKLGSDTKSARAIINAYDFFIAQTDYMVDVGKHLGASLGPRNKMPQPVPQNVPLAPMLKRFEKLVNVRIGSLPLIHCRVGTEEMTDDQLTENINAVITALTRKAPKHEVNLRSIFIKTTMGKSVRVGAPERSGAGAPKEESKAKSPTPNASEPIEPTIKGGDKK